MYILKISDPLHLMQIEIPLSYYFSQMHCFGHLYHIQEPGEAGEIEICFTSSVTSFFPLLLKMIPSLFLKNLYISTGVPDMDNKVAW